LGTGCADDEVEGPKEYLWVAVLKMDVEVDSSL
jgi:hypothetical protein